MKCGRLHEKFANMEDGNIANDLRQLLASSSVSGFLRAATYFIQTLEAEDLQGSLFYKTSHLALLSLYNTAINLPDIDLRYSNGKKNFDRDSLFQNQNCNHIAGLADKAFYSEAYDPIYPSEGGPAQGWLVDDYADIYRDIKIELQKIHLGTNEAVEDALWQLKFGFSFHWGIHCINALRALHYLKYNHQGF